MIRELASHVANCAHVRRLLARHAPPRLSELYWYGLPMRYATSARGIGHVVAWNLGRREHDEIAKNHGWTSLYHAAPTSTGVRICAPTVWHCRSLESRPWWDEKSDVRDALEHAAPDIIEEYHQVAAGLATHPDNASLTERGRWTGMFLTGAAGARNETLLRRCPRTAALIESLPLCRAFGFAMFSGMDPRTHVAPHCGSSNLRLRYHLGVDVPEPELGWLRVGEEWRRWETGRVLAFDDSFEHEVRYEGNRRRVVLIVDVWHPSLGEADIAVLSDPVFRRFGKYVSTEVED